jgi:hypothetical protein
MAAWHAWIRCVDTPHGAACPAIVVRRCWLYLPAGLDLWPVGAAWLAAVGRLAQRRQPEEVDFPLLHGGAPMVAVCRSGSVLGLLGLGGLQDLGPWLWVAWRHLAMEAA